MSSILKPKPKLHSWHELTEENYVEHVHCKFRKGHWLPYPGEIAMLLQFAVQCWWVAGVVRLRRDGRVYRKRPFLRRFCTCGWAIIDAQEQRRNTAAQLEIVKRVHEENAVRSLDCLLRRVIFEGDPLVDFDGKCYKVLSLHGEYDIPARMYEGEAYYAETQV